MAKPAKSQVQALARQWRAKLEWPVIDKISIDPGEQAAMVLPDPVARQHVVVRRPQRQEPSPWHDLELLHALVRAHFVEKRHPLFGVAYLINVADLERARLTPFLLAAGAWFTTGVMMEICVFEQKRYNDHVVAVLKKMLENQGATGMTEQQLVLLALALAAYKKYNAPAMPLASQSCSLRDYTMAFLETPTDPDTRMLTSLANTLLAVFADYQVEMTPSGKGFDAWRLVRGVIGKQPA